MFQINLPDDVKYILNILRAAGYEAYAVGGCVRDCLLGKLPKDWDVTTSALPEDVKRLFPRTVDTGIKHGTVTVMVKSEGYEVTTYRVDGEYTDGRHPESVSFTASLDEDLKRRDFTINALVYNEATGVTDLFGGTDDLENKIIRCVGVAEERFGEDALRILRAIRFSAQLGFDIEEDTYTAAVKLGANLAKVSAERIKAELDKTLMSDNPGHICLLKTMGLDKVILPELQGADEEFLKTALARSNKELTVRWAVACLSMELGAQQKVYEPADPDNIYNTPGALTYKTLHRLKFDNKTLDRIVLFIRTFRNGFPGGEDEHIRIRCRRLASILGWENTDDFLNFCEAVECGMQQAGGEKKTGFIPDKYRLDNTGTFEKASQFEVIYAELLRAKQNGECISLKELAVNGRDLMECGIESGTEIGKTLNGLLELVLKDTDMNTKEKLIEAVKRLR